MSAPLLPSRPIPPLPAGMRRRGENELYEPGWLLKRPRKRPLVAITQADDYLLECLARAGWSAREALAGRRKGDSRPTLAYLSAELRYGLTCYVAIGIGDLPLLRVLRRPGPDPVIGLQTLLASVQVVAIACKALGVTTLEGLEAMERALTKMQEREAAA